MANKKGLKKGVKLGKWDASRLAKWKDARWGKKVAKTGQSGGNSGIVAEVSNALAEVNDQVQI